MKRSDITDAQVVEACRDFHSLRLHMADAILAERTGAPLKVIHRALERAHDRGLIECGVSLRTAWPTEKGLALLPA